MPTGVRAGTADAGCGLRRRRRRNGFRNFFQNSPIWIYVSAIAVVLTFTVLIPRLTPTVSDPKDPERPFSASVTITNSGLLPLNHVSASIAVREIRGNGSVPFVNFERRSDYSSQVGNTQWFPHRLWPDDRFTVALNEVFDSRHREGPRRNHFGIGRWGLSPTP
jgi:hypothetical protein